MPLHIALDRQTPSLDVVRLLVMAHPAGVSARRGDFTAVYTWNIVII